MARSFVYIVSENPEVIEKIKKSHESDDVSFYTYSGNQWREGLDNPFFRSQLVNGVPALSTGLNPLTAEPSSNTGNVVSFPVSATTRLSRARVSHRPRGPIGAARGYTQATPSVARPCSRRSLSASRRLPRSGPHASSSRP